jgi:hypothetical protein
LGKWRSKPTHRPWLDAKNKERGYTMQKIVLSDKEH